MTEYRIVKGTMGVGRACDLSTDYLVEVVNGEITGKIELNAEQWVFLEGKSRETLDLPMFQRALLSPENLDKPYLPDRNPIVALTALCMLNPKVQTASLALSIMKQRKAKHGEDDCLVRHMGPWKNYRAFSDIEKLRELAENYGIVFKNSKGAILPRVYFPTPGLTEAEVIKQNRQRTLSGLAYLVEQEKRAEKLKDE